MKLLWVLVWTWSLVAFSADPDPPCWCEALHKRVHLSRRLLIEKYGQTVLEEVCTFSTSGRGHPLSQRLFESLQQRKPFRIGSLGGSFACPVGDGNTWTANVTRWLNDVLSVSTCEPGAHSLLDSKYCMHDPVVKPSPPLTGCAEPAWRKQPPLFCAPYNRHVTMGVLTANFSVGAFNEHLQKEAMSLHPTGRSLDRACLNSVPVQRVCNVYQGSGKYCTIIHGSKGGKKSTRNHLEMPITLDQNEPLDLVIWDHSVNDRGVLSQAAPYLRSGFVDDLLEYFPSLAGLAMVYWPPTSKIFNPKLQWDTSMELLHLPMLKEMFGHGGRFHHVSLLTISLSNFLNAGNATCAEDFLSPTNKHPSPSGNAMFADLLIWQLLHPLHEVLTKHCSSRQVITGHHRHRAWHLDNMRPEKCLLDDESGFKRMNGSLYGTPAAPAPLKSSKSLHVHAALLFITPLTGRLFPTSELAIMCIHGDMSPAVSWGAAVDHGVFVPFNKSHTNPEWVEMDANALFAKGCAGWQHAGVRLSNRFDDEFLFSPAATAKCPGGGAPFTPACTRLNYPGWTQEGKYPHRRNLGDEFPPSIQEVDFVVRIAANFTWDHICFEQTSRQNNVITVCDPDVYWRPILNDGSAGDWRTDRLEVGSPNPQDLILPSCFRWPGKASAGEFAGGNFIVSWPAERCSVWKWSTSTESTDKSTDTFIGNRVTEPLTLLSSPRA
jgi:hypothetical protein